jgi:hypothetical protein
MMLECVYPSLVFLILIVAYLHFIIKAPIICGREPAATAEEKKLGAERTAELSAKVNQVIFFLGLCIVN